jgi:SAM-dependent methyltransferase
VKAALLFRLLDPVSEAVARQLARPRGWFGRTVMTRLLNRGNRDLVEATLDGLRLGPEARLLDVGFGGGVLLDLARRRGARHLAGVDPSVDAVAFLRGRSAHWRGVDVRLEIGAVESLPFADGAFDLVATTNTVYFWPDLGRAFGELRRVVAPGGWLTVGYTGSAKLRAFGEITRHGFHFHEDGAVRSAAERAGFRAIEVAELHGRVTEGDRVLRGRG